MSSFVGELTCISKARKDIIDWFYSNRRFYTGMVRLLLPLNTVTHNISIVLNTYPRGLHWRPPRWENSIQKFIGCKNKTRNNNFLTNYSLFATSGQSSTGSFALGRNVNWYIRVISLVHLVTRTRPDIRVEILNVQGNYIQTATLPPKQSAAEFMLQMVGAATRDRNKDSN